MTSPARRPPVGLESERLEPGPPEPVAGPEDWRRVSETWIDPDLGDPELGMEIGARLTDYICALEPLRRSP